MYSHNKISYKLKIINNNYKYNFSKKKVKILKKKKINNLKLKNNKILTI